MARPTSCGAIRTTGQNWMYLMDGMSILNSVGVNTVSTEWEAVGSGDYNGDGKADILWRNSVSRPELALPHERSDDR